MRRLYGIRTAGKGGALLAAATAAALAAGAPAAWEDPQPEAAPIAQPGPPTSPAPFPDEPEDGSGSEPDAAPVVSPPSQGLPEATIHFKDGKQLTGLVVDLTEEEVVLRVSGVSASFDRATIDHIERLAPVEERYLQMRKAIGDDGQQLTLLVRWLLERERFDLALQEARRAVALAPDDTEAVRLLRVVEGRIELMKNRRPELADRPREAPQPAGPAPSPPQFPLLTEAQINLLKVYEVDLDSPPRLIVSRRTVEDLLAAYADHPLVPSSVEGRDAILRWRDEQVLDLMFRLRARDFYGRVEVLESPDSMKQFRDDVNRGWLVNSCATNRCHGGEEAGRLRLFNRRPSAEASYYTNFLILDRFRLENGDPLINYDDPAQSRLLDLAVAREDSLYPHPVVRNENSGRDEWRPAFRSKTDRRAQETIEWIRAMYLPHPEYPIEYEPPTGAALPPQPEPQSR